MLGGLASYGAGGAACGVIVGGVHVVKASNMTNSAAKSVIGHHTAVLGAAAAVFGGTQGFLDNMFGPSMTNNVAAGCASGAVMGVCFCHNCPLNPI